MAAYDGQDRVPLMYVIVSSSSAAKLVNRELVLSPFHVSEKNWTVNILALSLRKLKQILVSHVTVRFSIHPQTGDVWGIDKDQNTVTGGYSEWSFGSSLTAEIVRGRVKWLNCCGIQMLIQKSKW